MDAKIDYLSFTVMVDCRDDGTGRSMVDDVLEALEARHPWFCAWAGRQGTWETGGARGHYGASLFNPLCFAAIRFGGSANHILVELPGTACQLLRDDEALETIMLEAADRLTRLDIAVDFPGGVDPLAFVGAGYNERFKSHAELVSESGITAYVGSMKSERFARVYKYNPPHPRAGVLRVETVLRADFAKQAARVLYEAGLLALVEKVGNTFGWLSPAWQPTHVTDGKLRASRIDRNQPGRVRWLHNIVIPALAKAAQEGLLDWPETAARIDAIIAAMPDATRKRVSV